MGVHLYGWGPCACAFLCYLRRSPLDQNFLPPATWVALCTRPIYVDKATGGVRVVTRQDSIVQLHRKCPWVYIPVGVGPVLHLNEGLLFLDFEFKF